MRITELFDNGEFVVSAEVGPPKGIHIDGMVEEAKKYLTDVHFVNVTDNQSSVMRLGSLATCKVLKDAGLNPIFQLTCRDRNRIALQSDLLSAAMLGIDNILCLTGDHTKLGDHPQAKPVFDLDSVSLLHTVFGIDNPMNMMEFELPVKTFAKDKGSDFIDGYITPTRVLIEQKGSHVDLSAKARQSDGMELTPFQQGLRYASGLGTGKYPRWIVACNFTTFEVHDMEHPNDAPEIIQLTDWKKNIHVYPSWSMTSMSI